METPATWLKMVLVSLTYQFSIDSSIALIKEFFVRDTETSISWQADIAPYPANIYLFKVINRNARKRCEICSKLTIKTPERRQWRRSSIFINFEHITHLLLSVSIVDFEQVNASSVSSHWNIFLYNPLTLIPGIH